MATDFELALFEEELREVRCLPEASRWELERDESVPLGLFTVMHPKSKPAELYRARLRWKTLFGAFSLKYVHFQTSADNDPTAWPKCFGFRPGSLDACLPWTAEGHGLHPEWEGTVTGSFPKVERPIHFAVLQLQLSLDNSYEGRGTR